jgi:hypothetical protein
MSESKSVADVKKALGAETVDMLNVFEKDGTVCLKPKSFLGKDVFAGIAQRIKELGGSYGNGLFKIPVETGGLSQTEELHRLVMDFKNHSEKEFEKILRKIGDLK